MCSRLDPGRENSCRGWRPPRAVAIAVGLGIALSGCVSESQYREIARERDEAHRVLKRMVGEIEKERASTKLLRAEMASVATQVEKERARAEEEKTRAESLSREKKVLGERLQTVSRDHARLKDTHAKLEKMSQESLGELSELRQRHESLDAEKQRLKELASIQNARMTDLTREVDDLRAELTRTREAVRVMQGNNATTVDAKLAEENKRLREISTAQKQQIVAMSEDLVALRSSLAMLKEKGSSVDEAEKTILVNDVDPKFLLKSTEKLARDRYRRAIQGQITWDGFDIAVACVAGGVVLLLTYWLMLLVRVRRLRRRIARLESAVAVEETEEEEEVEVEKEETRPVAPRAEGAAARRRARSSSLSSEEEYAPDRIAPSDFSPIMRSRSSRRESVAETASREPAPAGKPARKVIGAWRQDEPAGASAGVDVDTDDEYGSQTQIISSSDLDLLNSAGLDSATSPAPAVEEAPAPESAGGDDDQGTAEEQDLLQELKSIINKKFDKVPEEE